MPRRCLSGGGGLCGVRGTTGRRSDYPMGVLDHYRIPKKTFYTFRRTGPAPPMIISWWAFPVQFSLMQYRMLIADSADISASSVQWPTPPANARSRGEHHPADPRPATVSTHCQKTTIAGKSVGCSSRGTRRDGTGRRNIERPVINTLLLACVAPDNAPRRLSGRRAIARWCAFIVWKRISRCGGGRANGNFIGSPPSGPVLVSLTRLDGKTLGRAFAKKECPAILNIKHIPQHVFSEVGKATVKKYGELLNE